MSLSPLPPLVSPLQGVLRAWVQAAVATVGVELEESEIPWEHPALEDHGDWATPIALKLFQQRAKWPESTVSQVKSPRELAEMIKDILIRDRQASEQDSWIDSISVAGPGFINISLSAEYWASVPSIVLTQGENYGKLEIGSGQTWEVEHTSANPNKAMHLGHLRNNVTGMALSNIWEAVGIKVIREAVDNNRGISIAKLMWGYLKFARRSNTTPVDLKYWSEHPEEWHTPETAQERPDRFMDALYVQAAQDTESNPEVEAQVRQWVVDWEAKDPLNWKLWELVLEYIYQGQNMTLDRLHNRFEYVWHEHEHYQAGKDWVEQGLAQGIFRQLDDGAIITDLAAYNLPDTVVQKKDGTALYITQDLALTQLKKEKYEADRMIWVIGPEQSLAMQQLFAVCDQLGIVDRERCEHVSFGFMSIKGLGKMSSRKGNTIFIDDLIDLSRDSLRERIQNDALSSDEKEQVAELLAESAVKYAILKVGRTTDTQFDLQNSISLEGDSGPYLQYTHARCQSILRQAGEAASAVASEPQTLHPSEVALSRWMERFPETVAEAARQIAPNLIAQYLYELAQRFNALYAQVSVLQAETPELRAHRLAEVAGVAQILRQGFALLGFAAVDRM
jgi:arginyl-tRNA synthetase